MEDFDYAAVLPTMPPEGTVEAAKQLKTFRRQRLVYQVEYYTDPLNGMREKGVRVTCTGCGGSQIEQYVGGGEGCHHGGGRFGFFNHSTMEAVTDGGVTRCPLCGAEAWATHISDMNNGKGFVSDEEWVMTAGRHEDKLVLFGWLLQRRVYKDGHAEFGADPYEAYVVERKKLVRLMGYQKNMTAIRMLHHWEQRKQYMDLWGAGTVLNFDPEILTGSTAENSALGTYLAQNRENAYPVSYLAAWRRHPQLENLVVQGAGRLLGRMIDSAQSNYYYSRPKGAPKLPDIDFREKRPAAMLGLSKPDFHTVVWANLDAWELKVCKELMQAEHLQCGECIRMIRSIGATPVHALLCRTEDIRGQSIRRILRYCEKQKQKPETLTDYWRMAQELGEEPERYPKDVRAAHDRVLRALEERENEKLAAKAKAEREARRGRFAEAVSRYTDLAWERGDICIRPAACEEELLEESKQLAHCVRTYGRKIADGESMIFFIRRKESPDKSWYTLELLPDGTVSQNRGHRNCARTEEVQEFETAWLAWMAGRKKEKERETA